MKPFTSILFVIAFIFSNATAQLNPQPYEGNPVVPKGALGTWDDSGVWWPSVTVVNDTFYMIYNGNPNFPYQPASIGLATSVDGYAFTKNPSNALLAADGSGFDAYSAVGGFLYFEGGTWYLYYSGRSTTPNQPGNVIGRASSNNPYGPWTRSNDTLLTVGSPGEWDDEFISTRAILPTDSGLVLYYWAGNTWTGMNRKPQIGMATSIDGGLSWQKYDDPLTTTAPYAESDPVLATGISGSYDDAGIWGCSVLKSDSKWEMFYTGDDGTSQVICYATSSDGITWEKHTANPLLIPEQDPASTSKIFEGAATALWDNKYFIYYDYGVTTNGIGMATSTRYLNVPSDYSTIQSAIDAAFDGDVVLVDEGLYYENINFKGKAITVASHFILDQDTSHISKTIIDGSKPSDPNKASVVTLDSGEDTTSVLCGLTITGGSGTIISDWGWQAGGGIFVLNSGVRITNNIIENNLLTSTDMQTIGGGINIYLGYTIIENNTIRYNQVESSNNYAAGGGVFLQASGRIENNTIINNKASYSGTDHSGIGGGVSCISNTSNYFVDIYNNTISDNQVISTTGAYSGGIDLRRVNTKFKGNTISKNRINGALYDIGAGMRIVQTEESSIIDNNIFSYNKSETGNYTVGGGLYLYDSSPAISNNTFKNNQARYGGGIASEYAAPKIVKNIFVHNKADSIGGGIALYTEEESGSINQRISFQKNGNVVVLDPSHKVKTEIQKSASTNKVLIINNTFTENSADSAGGAFMTENTDVEILNSILWDNTSEKGAELWVDNADVSVSYSDIQGGWVGDGNLDADPLFVSDDSLYHLSEGSPCIDTGNPDPAYNDAEDPGNPGYALWPSLGTIRSDMGATGGALVTAIEGEPLNRAACPRDFVLHQNYPNPFNPITNIEFQIPHVAFVTLKIYNVLGQEIASLIDKGLNAGEYNFKWDASNFASGVYFYKLSTKKGFTKTRKLLLVK